MSQIQLLRAPSSPEPRAHADNAWTPEDLAQALVDYLQPQGPVWEAHAGGGAFVRACQRRGIETIATDIDPALGWRVHDAGLGPPDTARPRALVGNPPWGFALDHLSMGLALPGVDLIAWILPGGLLHRTEWRPVLRVAWPDEYIALGRVSYTGPGREHAGGASMTDSAMYVWRRRGGLWTGRGLLRQLVQGQVLP
jgi:hypothetical protein